MSTDGHRPARWTLLLGNNGTGKTTLLQVLAILGHGRGSPSIPTAIQRAPFERTTGDSTATTAIADVYHSRTLDARNKGETSRINAKFIGLSYDISRSVIAAPTCFGYGAARRMASGQLSRKSDPGPTASLFDDSVFLRNGEEWLLQLDYAASKAKPRSEMATRLKSRLKKVRQILVDLLPDVSDIRFSSDESSPSPQVEFKTPFGWVPLNGIAYGYQSLVAWCVDLASRMVDLYPESPDPVAEPAVVLIDEIELHLHPSWQRDLMSFLTERFPNTQFIASAHSPLVVQAAPSVDANIALLQRDGNRVVIRNDMESIRGWRIDQVLSSDLYGTGPRAPDIQKLIDERRRLLAKPKLKKRDKDRLDELDMEIGPLTPGETPEEIKTTQLLRDSLQLMQARMGAAKESS